MFYFILPGRGDVFDEGPDLRGGVFDVIDREPLFLGDGRVGLGPARVDNQFRWPGMLRPVGEDSLAGLANSAQARRPEQITGQEQVHQVVYPLVLLAAEDLGAGVELLGDQIRHPTTLIWPGDSRPNWPMSNGSTRSMSRTSSTSTGATSN